jgi:phage gp46-like protein
MDHEIDPETGDLTGRRITGLGNAVYLRLAVPKGTWFGDKDLGSLLHRLKREKATPRARGLAIQYANDALRPLVADGRAASITVDAGAIENGRLALHIEVVDAKGKSHAFIHELSVT